MADIIVTVPKDQVQHFMDIKVPAIDAWWYLGQRPKHLQPGDLIGFVFTGAIMYAATVTFIEKNESGKWEVHFEDCGWIKPIPHEHFRGFRYFDIEEHVYGADDE